MGLDRTPNADLTVTPGEKEIAEAEIGKSISTDVPRRGLPTRSNHADVLYLIEKKQHRRERAS
jgi:hypothetical protein